MHATYRLIVRCPASQGGEDDADEHSQAVVQAALAKKYAGSREWGAAHDASTMSAINPFASTIVGVCCVSWHASRLVPLLLRCSCSFVWPWNSLITCSRNVLSSMPSRPYISSAATYREWLLWCAGMFPGRREEAVPPQLHGVDDEHWRQGQPSQLLADFLPAWPASKSSTFPEVGAHALQVAM
jgi:hypothetical protein